MQKEKIIPVILCGGSGTRLWPASRENHPKQFLSLMDDFSLLQNTMKRAMRITDAPAENVVVVTLDAMKTQVETQLAEINPTATQHILCEPSARNTAAAVALAAIYVEKTFGPESILWVLPSDHHINDENALAAAFGHALVAAQNGNLVTYGIRPTRPETGYGYIHLGEPMNETALFNVSAFVEKPDAQKAQDYIDHGGYLWNSGMFLFSAKAVLEDFKKHAHDVLNAVSAAMEKSTLARTPDKDGYAQVEKVPFDIAIMEKSTKVAVIPCDPEWSDVGSWESLWELRDKDAKGNVVEGRAACYDTKNCLIQAQDRLIACAGLENLVVIETDDAILIADRCNSDAMRTLVKGLKSAGCREVVDAPAKAQPWTMTKRLDDSDGYSIQEIMLRPGESVGFQAHAQPHKFWTVLEGTACIRAGQDEVVLGPKEMFFIPASMPYTLSNHGTLALKIVEVTQGQAGSVRLTVPGQTREAA